MSDKVRHLAHAAIIAALYVVLTNLQNLLVPGSATWAIQLRLSEVLCILAFFTPAAIPGLTVGCFVFNLNYAGALPMDILLGSLATFWGTWAMWQTRKWKVRDYPLPGMLMPALTNAVFVGWELSVYIGGGFWMNALYVAIGEAAVLLIFGTALYYAMRNRKLDVRLFG